ncbi:CMP-N-acetylneuraminic acid synthetase [Lachnospiraceae bacterium]|nr:CMP-N-acetylneuraminic acid synthetase [Lachnospiraceae bacterium]
MGVTAIIPARAASKSIPNQNVRIVAGHPLVYYSIMKAKKSRYIDRVIVTTDSEDIGIIANQLGVELWKRSDALSRDDVTIDAVVYDVVKNCVDSEYIVTLQPTSPLLSVDTLDNAFEYCFEKKLDSLVAVINDQRYSWVIDDNKRIPNYTRRVNREELPKNYLESGAFLISKTCIVSQESRIGDNTDIYEIPRIESYGIDSFENLQIVKYILQSKKTAIYVNGNNMMGMGHIYRSLEIADELYSKPDIIYNSSITDVSVFGSTTHTLIKVDDEEELINKCKSEQYELFINDVLDTSIDYMNRLRDVLPHTKIVNFEDAGDGILKADVVFNALYNERVLPYVYSGEKYFIIGRRFLYYEPIKIKDKVKNVFISFGGADPSNYTERLLKIVSKENYSNVNFIVVVGRANKNYKKLLRYSNKNIKIEYDVTNMPELMSKCDFAITSRGRTGFELAYLGIPTIAIAQNHREEMHSFVSNENGFSYIGLNPSDSIIESNLQVYINMSMEVRLEYQKKLLSHDLRSGRTRVMGLINYI